MHLFSRSADTQSSSDDQQRRKHLVSAPPQQNPLVIDGFLSPAFCSAGPGGPQSIYEAADFAPGYIHSRWPLDQQLSGVAPPGRVAAVPQRTVYAPGPATTQAPVPVWDLPPLYGSPVGPSNSQSTLLFGYPPSSPSPLLHPSTSWPASSRASSQYANHSASSGAFQRMSAIPPPQFGIPTGLVYEPMRTGAVQQGSVQQGSGDVQSVPVSRIPSPHWPNHPSVESSIPSTASTLKTRGERWDQPASFLCMCKIAGTLCEAPIAGDKRSVINHLRDAHNFTCDGHKTVCPWYDCEKEMRPRSIPRHIVTCHLAVKVHCSACGLPLCRKDAEKKHRQACPGPQKTGP